VTVIDADWDGMVMLEPCVYHAVMILIVLKLYLT